MYEKINNDLKEAMKNQDKFTLSVLRMLKSTLQVEGISLKRELTDQDVLMVIKKNVKQRKDSIVEFEKYNKTDEIANLKKEIQILEKYLPEELTEEQIDQEIENVFAIEKPTNMKDMGKSRHVFSKQKGKRKTDEFIKKHYQNYDIFCRKDIFFFSILLK